ncbi:MAG: hypothetical protein Q4D48_00075 [Coriobacteriales bacterium]|jgi:hypothetical protein|nr:hypothetical protein [Coriobacteriales bacterium]
MMFVVLAAICIVLPTIAMLAEWIVSARLSERHHSKHDTYVIPFALTGALSLAMFFMGLLGILLSWLCYVGVFRADITTMIGFFASFVVVMFVMWSALRRYRVATFDDHLEVTPFAGRKQIIKYSDIDRMRWSTPFGLTGNRSILISVDGEVQAVLIGTFDLDQILLRINRNDVLDNA